MGEPLIANDKKGFGKKIIMFAGVVTAVLVIVMLVAFKIIPLPSFGGSGVSGKFTVLYQNLDLKDSAAVVEALEEAGYKDYKLEDGGRTILIGKKQQDEARISLAAKGIPSGGVIGFEIFDQGGQLGATDFDKRIKLTRALSGELSRNISRIYGIEDAKVQIVIPEKSMFAKEKVPVTAAVFVNLKKGFLLSPDQVSGIRALVASSVEDCQQDNVTVVDYNGKVLSSDDYRRNYSRYLSEMQRSSGDKGGFFKNIIGNEEKSDLPPVSASGSLSLAYQKLKSEKKNTEKSIFDKLLGRKSIEKMSVKELEDFKFKFKKQYEKDAKEKTEYILSQFFPKNSYKVNVNVDLNNLTFDKKKDFDTLINRLTLVILLDSNNSQIKLTPEVKEAVFKAIAASVGYVRGRDRIELRFAPMLESYDKESLFNSSRESKKLETKKITQKQQENAQKNRAKKIDKKTSPHFLVIGKLKIHDLFADKKIWAFVIGILLLLSLLMRRKKALIPETSKDRTSLFEKVEKTEEDLAADKSIVDDFRSEIEKNPDKIAALLERWWQND